MKLLITRHDKIGDFITALPLAVAIKTQFPTTHITLLVSPVNEHFAKNLAFVDAVIVYEKTNFWGLLRRIRRERFDASISCFITTRLGWLLWLGNIATRIAPATKIAQIFFNRSISQRRSLVHMSEWQYNLELGMALFHDFNPTFTPPLLSFDVQKSTEKKVVFHSGSGGSTDGNLTLKEYIYLAKKASSLPNVTIYFTFGPDDEELKKELEKKLDFPATILPAFETILDFCKFLSDCALFVSTSTGPMHLAGAVNAPTLSFFGDSLFASSARWATISESSKQSNFTVPKNYDKTLIQKIERELLRVLS